MLAKDGDLDTEAGPLPVPPKEDDLDAPKPGLIKSKAVAKIVETTWFVALINILIIGNTVVMALETPYISEECVCF